MALGRESPTTKRENRRPRPNSYCASGGNAARSGGGRDTRRRLIRVRPLRAGAPAPHHRRRAFSQGFRCRLLPRAVCDRAGERTKRPCRGSSRRPSGSTPSSRRSAWKRCCGCVRSCRENKKHEGAKARRRSFSSVSLCLRVFVVISHLVFFAGPRSSFSRKASFARVGCLHSTRALEGPPAWDNGTAWCGGSCHERAAAYRGRGRDGPAGRGGGRTSPEGRGLEGARV